MVTSISTDYEFRSPADIVAVMEILLQKFPYLEKAEMAISELMVNAMEHGNLEISYQEKTALLKTNTVMDEVDNRLKDPLYGARRALLEVEEFTNETFVSISDEGPGFIWADFLDQDLSKNKGLHGRGISLALSQCKSLNYVGRGNKVVATFSRPDA